MRLALPSLSFLGVLALSRSDIGLALSPVSHDINNQHSQATFPASGAVFGDFQLVDGHVEVKPEQIESYTASSSCFPALDFVMPSKPPANLNNWWCKATDEYAFLGFSYEVEACESTVICVSDLSTSN
jgi:hypothetical protein